MHLYNSSVENLLSIMDKEKKSERLINNYMVASENYFKLLTEENN